MTLIVYFIFTAVLLGAGAMLSPAYPTVQPRIGLSAALALAVIGGGAVFYGTLVRWNTLVVDYMLFLIVTSIFLGGTLSYGQKRAENRGEELADADQGWPGPFDLIGLLAALVLYIVIALQFGVPNNALLFDTTRINSGEASLYTTNAPAFTALTAYLSGQLVAPLREVQLAVGAVMASIAVWMTYDIGAEMRNKSLGRVLAFIIAPVLVILVATGNGALLMGIVFLLAFAAFTLRFMQHGWRIDAFTAGLMLGAIALTAAPMPLVALIAVAAAAIWLAVKRSPVRGIAFAAAVIAIALVATLPTLTEYGWPF